MIIGKESAVSHHPNTKTGRIKTAGKGSAGDILIWELPGPAAALWGEAGGGAIWAQRALAGAPQHRTTLVLLRCQSLPKSVLHFTAHRAPDLPTRKRQSLATVRRRRRDALAGDPRPKSIRFLDPSNCRLPSTVPCWETQGFNVVRVAVVFSLSNREINSDNHHERPTAKRRRGTRFRARNRHDMQVGGTVTGTASRWRLLDVGICVSSAANCIRDRNPPRLLHRWARCSAAAQRLEGFTTPASHPA
ncbi:hypothetical protein CPLU01_04338 [Colletotrichum plurivorum]|uniref:Uncharacterized protein n=1 Tax=Colletotrichum plurivorum TaxID=2175906 RepID=A0A8H6KPV1_9PEZI|nr:hypothetical protein CPLU01_04338 [Colletotrichum plurivorum]